MRIGIATTRPLPEPDPDEQMLLDALVVAGIDAQMVAWKEDDGSGYGAVVLRSTWDYHYDVARFVDWLSGVEKLINPLPVVLGNLHKRYLFALQEAGVPIVPTALVPRGTTVGSLEMESAVVVKPAVGAASWKVRSFSVDEAEIAERYVEELASDIDVLVQPLLHSVALEGERSLVWIDGEFTHKVVKEPRFHDGDESVSVGLGVNADEREIGEAAIRAYLEWVPGGQDLLYARVDVMALDDGRTVVSELEVTEPSLFFAQEPRSLRRFVDGLVRRL